MMIRPIRLLSCRFASTTTAASTIWAEDKLVSLLDAFDAPIRFAAGYGSGVFRQTGYDGDDSKVLLYLQNTDLSG
jgi:hypothetical protein